MRVYDKDFKEEAVKLSYEVGPTAAAKKLGIPVTTLYTWRNNANRYRDMAVIGSGHKRVDPKTVEILNSRRNYVYNLIDKLEFNRSIMLIWQGYALKPSALFVVIIVAF